VCNNGMMVAAGKFNSIHVRHSGNVGQIIDATYQMVEQFPAVLQSVERFSRLQLTAPQQHAFAEAALQLRYDDPALAPIGADQLTRPERREDAEPTLWNTFNAVQEHLLQGGLRGVNPETQKKVRTRSVSSISENTRLNRALWSLTEKMAELMA